MKRITAKFVVFNLIVLTTFAFSQNVNLMGSLNPTPGGGYADVWGYEQDGREYALMGIPGGTSIIDVTDPTMPVEIIQIPGPFSFYEWRDIKTYSTYAYVTSEGGGQYEGLQVIDLSQLPATATLVYTFDSTFTRAHNLYIDDGYAYVVGTGNGGMHILDLSNPIHPVEASYYSSSGYIHDVYVWNDTAYVSSGDTYDVVDVTDKQNPTLVSESAALPGIYAHSGWLTEDKRYFIATDEFNVRDLIIWDLQDRTTWNIVVPTWQMTGDSPIHNVFVLEDYLHISYYKDGYVVLDISDPTNPQFAGQYDTYPSPSGHFEGAWGVYPYLSSGYVLVSDMSTGLYVLDFLLDNDPTSINDESTLPENFSLKQNYPNPFNPSTKIKYTIPNSPLSFGEGLGVRLNVYDVLGNEVATLVNEYKTAGTYEVEFSADDLPAGRQGLSSGIYFYTLQAGDFIQTKKMILIQ